MHSKEKNYRNDSQPSSQTEFVMILSWRERKRERASVARSVVRVWIHLASQVEERKERVVS